jgi:hypothetical protein
MKLKTERILKSTCHPVGRVTDCDLLPGFDVLLCEEDLDAEVEIVKMMCVGTACVVDTGKTNANHWSARESLKLINNVSNFNDYIVSLP